MQIKQDKDICCLKMHDNELAKNTREAINVPDEYPTRSVCLGEYLQMIYKAPRGSTLDQLRRGN